MNKVEPIDEEYIFEGSMIISQTDLEGVITFVNRKFCEVSAYKLDELVGQKHNIMRHPDMPRAVFAKMWSSIEGGQVWNGLIKNLRKDGLYYWADTEILPIRDEDDKITGYISVRKVPSRKDIEESIEVYAKMLETEN
jgi:aerotaxis receptor